MTDKEIKGVLPKLFQISKQLLLVKTICAIRARIYDTTYLSILSIICIVQTSISCIIYIKPNVISKL